MSTRFRGHEILAEGERFIYADTLQGTVETWLSRGCGFCGLADTSEGHDGCLGTLPGVLNACCGHGDPEMAYVQLLEGRELRGDEAVRWLDQQRQKASRP